MTGSLNPNTFFSISSSYTYTPCSDSSYTPFMQYIPKQSTDSTDSTTIKVANKTKIEVTNTVLEEIEELTYKLLDLEEKNEKLEAENELNKIKLDSLYATRDQHMAKEANFVAAEHTIVRLNADLKTEIQNRDHFRALVAQQDAFIKEMKNKIEEYKTAKHAETEKIIADLKAKTEQADHLAKQAVRLTDENSNFRAGLVQFQEMQTEFGKIKTESECLKEENTSLIAKNENLKLQLKTWDEESVENARDYFALETENTQLKEQNNRYLEENRQLHDQVNYLGVECDRLNLILKKIQQELALYQNMNAYQNSAISVAYPFLQKLATRILASSADKEALGLFEDYKEHSEKEALEIMKLHMPETPVVAATSRMALNIKSKA